MKGRRDGGSASLHPPLEGEGRRTAPGWGETPPKRYVKLPAPNFPLPSPARTPRKCRSAFTGIDSYSSFCLLRFGLPKWDEKTFIYLDPPYYEQGRQLYYDYYKPDDHADLAQFIGDNMKACQEARTVMTNQSEICR